METRIFEDHCDSYICWKTLGLKGITAVHADAHLDYRDMGISPATLAKIINTSDRKILEEISATESILWDGLNPGNYLYPAIADGTVSKLVWIIPPNLFAGQDLLEWAKEELRKWKELTIDEYAGLYMDNGVVKGSLDGAALEICLLEDFETHEENVVWDIDTDYFLDYQDRAWMNPFVFVDKLSHCCPVPVMVNIAYSVRGGYTIPTQKYLGDMVKMAVEEDIAEDILRDYQKLKICDEKIIREDEEGIEELLKEIEGNGFFRPYVHLRLALLFKSRGDQKKEEFHRSVTAEEKPELLIEDFDWAMNYYRLKDYEKALSIFSNTENIDSGYFIISNLLGALALSEMKMYEKSDEKWLKILSHNCFHSLSDVVKSNILLQVSSNLEAWGKLPRALEILDRAGGIYGENHRIFFQRGNVLRDLGNYEKAARNYRKYLFMRPDNFESLEVQYQLAKIYEIQNKKSLAASEYRKLQARDRTGLYQLRAATGLIRVSRD